MRARIITGTAVTLAAAAVITACAVNTPAAGYDNTFTFTDSAVTAENTEGSGYKISGTDLTINEAGTYVVTGECAQGSITVKKGTTGVTIILNGLTLTSSTTAPLSVNKNAEAVIQIEGNNVLTDAEDTANESSDDFEGAAIKVKSGSTATITGSGTLTADGSGCKNGIKGGEAATVIIGESSTDTFTLNVSAANNALASDGNVTVNGMTAKKASDKIQPPIYDSVQFSLSVVSDSLRPHELQRARPPCPLPTPGAHPDSPALSQ